MIDKKSRRQGIRRGIAPAVFLSALLFLFALLASGCHGPASDSIKGRVEKEDSGKLKVVTTLFPYYDFLRQIAGGRIDLIMVVPAGMDSHSFEPTPADIITIQEADLLVCNGGSMELWLTKVLNSFEEGEGPDRIVTLMDYVDTVEEEIVEGMEAEAHDHSEDHTHEAGHIHEAGHEGELHGHDHEEDGFETEIEYDEHIWTSPVNAIKLTEVLTEVLCEENPEHAELYRANETIYGEKLKTLDNEFRRIVREGNRNMLIFGDKFPFRYFFEEYGLEYRAAFTGCSSDTEPSARTIAYLIDKVREKQIPAIYYLELSSHRVAEIIGEETQAEPLLLHSCHNVTRREFDSGITYLKLMERNAGNLRKGLN